MLTYQVKITIEATVEAEWLAWMKTVHVPDVIATGLIKSYQILKPEDQAHTYLFHYHFDQRRDYEQYQEQYGPMLKAGPARKFPDQCKAERMLFSWI